MNLLDKRKGGLIVLLALFIFACESNDELELPIDSNTNLKAYYTEIKVPYTLVQLDSVNTTVAGSSTTDRRILTGNFLSNDFGTVNATGFASFITSNTGSVSENDTYDSLVLTMVNTYYFGEPVPTQPQTLSLQQLTDTIARRTHYQFEAYPYNTEVGSVTFTPDPKVASSYDTMRIPLNAAFGQSFFNEIQSQTATAESDQLDSLLRNYLKGIAIVPQGNNNYLTGFSSKGARLTMYYSEPSDTVSSTYTFSLLIGSSNIAYDRTGTPIAGINQQNRSGNATDGGFYLQSGTGLSPVMDFSVLTDFVDSMHNESRNVLFNNVNLNIGFQQADSASMPPSILRGYFTEDDLPARFTIVSGQSTAANNSPGLFNNTSSANNPSDLTLTDLSEYSIQMTLFAQALNDSGGLDSTLLMLSPEFEYSINQLKVPSDSIKLEIYYSILE